MPLTIDQLAQEALQLPPSVRADLAEKLVESLDFPVHDDVRAAWASEALRRRDEIRSGSAETIPSEQVIAEARRLAGR